MSVSTILIMKLLATSLSNFKEYFDTLFRPSLRIARYLLLCLIFNIFQDLLSFSILSREFFGSSRHSYLLSSVHFKNRFIFYSNFLSSIFKDWKILCFSSFLFYLIIPRIFFAFNSVLNINKNLVIKF